MMHAHCVRVQESPEVSTAMKRRSASLPTPLR